MSLANIRTEHLRHAKPRALPLHAGQSWSLWALAQMGGGGGVGTELLKETDGLPLGLVEPRG
jgi:hypothetical protein